MKLKNLLSLIRTLLWNLWNIQIKITDSLSEKWILGPYTLAIWNVFGCRFGIILLDRAHGTDPGQNSLLLVSYRFQSQPGSATLHLTQATLVYSDENYVDSINVILSNILKSQVNNFAILTLLITCFCSC